MLCKYVVGKISLISVCLLLAAVLSFWPAHAGNKPAPAPLVLGSGLNIVTAETQASPRLRTWQQLQDNSFQLSWTENGVGPGAVALADIDGEGDSEVVVYGTCAIGTKKNPEYGYFINAYKQGKIGVYYSSYFGGLNNFVREKAAWNFTQNILASDLDGNGCDEIMLGTATHIALFHFNQNVPGKIEKTADVDLNILGTLIAGTPFSSRDGLAIGDIDGHLPSSPDGVEIVSTGHYRDANGYYKSYLLAFDDDLQLKAYISLHETEPDLGDFNINDVRIAETDADAVNEVWCAGWSSGHDTLVSWTVSDTGGFLRGPGLDLGPSSGMGPGLAVGKLTTSYKDELIVNYVTAGKSRLEVYQNDSGGIQRLAWKEYADRAIDEVHVVEGQLFTGGTQTAVPATRRGPYIEVMTSEYIAPMQYILNTIWSYGDQFNGNEIWGMAVGHGLVNRQ